MTKEVEIKLTNNEALVLFEYLGRNNDAKGFDETFVDQAEQRVLWDIECILETKLTEPFLDNYDELIASARLSVRDRLGE